MKTTFQVVTDKQKRIFNIELLSNIRPDIETYNGILEYAPIEIEMDDKLYEWFCEWCLCKDIFTRDIIIGDIKKLIGCRIISLDREISSNGDGNNIVELSFDKVELVF